MSNQITFPIFAYGFVVLDYLFLLFEGKGGLIATLFLIKILRGGVMVASGAHNPLV